MITAKQLQNSIEFQRLVTAWADFSNAANAQEQSHNSFTELDNGCVYSLCKIIKNIEDY